MKIRVVFAWQWGRLRTVTLILKITSMLKVYSLLFALMLKLSLLQFSALFPIHNFLACGKEAWICICPYLLCFFLKCKVLLKKQHLLAECPKKTSFCWDEGFGFTGSTGVAAIPSTEQGMGSLLLTACQGSTCRKWRTSCCRPLGEPSKHLWYLGPFQDEGIRSGSWKSAYYPNEDVSVSWQTIRARDGEAGAGEEVSPGDLLLSQRVAQHKGVSVLPTGDRLLVHVVCYCLCNFSSQEDFPIKKNNKKALHGLLSKQNVEHVCTQDFTPTHNFPSNVANGSCARP